MRALLLALAGVATAGAQISYDFAWQSAGSRIPGLTEFRAIIKNDGPAEVKIFGLDVLEAASHPPSGASWRPIPWVANVGIQQAVDAANKRGFFYYSGLVCEIGGALGSISLTGKLADIKEKAAVFFPVGAGLCAIGRAVWNREHPKIDAPSDLIPGIIYVPAGGRLDYALFATP